MLGAWLNLVVACQTEGDLESALAAAESALKLDPLSFEALMMKASLLEAMGRLRAAGNAYGIALRRMPPSDRLDPAARRAVKHGHELHTRHLTEMRNFLQREVADGNESRRQRRGPADGRIPRSSRGQAPPVPIEPVQYFYPGLPAIEFYDREDFPWLPEVEAQRPRSSSGSWRRRWPTAGQQPHWNPMFRSRRGYQSNQWAELNKSLNWSAYSFRPRR